MISTIFGYTYEQWGYVGAWYKRNFGPIEDINDCITAQMEYMTRYTEPPLSVEFEGVERENDIETIKIINGAYRTMPHG